MNNPRKVTSEIRRKINVEGDQARRAELPKIMKDEYIKHTVNSSTVNKIYVDNELAKNHSIRINIGGIDLGYVEIGSRKKTLRRKGYLIKVIPCGVGVGSIELSLALNN